MQLYKKNYSYTQNRNVGIEGESSGQMMHKHDAIYIPFQKYIKVKILF